MAYTSEKIIMGALAGITLISGGMAAKQGFDNYVTRERAEAHRLGEGVGVDRGRTQGFEEAVCSAQAYRMLGPAPTGLGSDGEAIVGHITDVARDCN